MHGVNILWLYEGLQAQDCHTQRIAAVLLRPVAKAQSMAPKALSGGAKFGQLPQQLRSEGSEGSNPHSERGQETFSGRLGRRKYPAVAAQSAGATTAATSAAAAWSANADINSTINVETAQRCQRGGSRPACPSTARLPISSGPSLYASASVGRARNAFATGSSTRTGPG